MNAVSLYLSTCRYVMQAKGEQPTSWSDLYKYLPYLRQALSCCVCTKILQIPMGPTDSICQHHICEACKGGKMRLRPSCSWCKDHSLYKENVQLRIVIQCYKRLCNFLSSLNLSATLSEIDNGDKNSILNIINEGTEIPDQYDYNANPLPMSALALTPSKIDNVPGGSTELISPPSTPVSPLPRVRTLSRRISVSATEKWDKDTQTEPVVSSVGTTADAFHHDDLDPLNDTNIDEIRRKSAHLPYRDDTGENAPRTSNVPHLSEHDYMKEGPLFYSVCMPNGNEPKLTIRRKQTAPVPASTKKKNRQDGNTSSSSQSGAESPHRVKKQKTKDGKRKGCRCGTATPTPGKLTCCGQRCPCYTSFKPCLDCICRGCHNPRKSLPLLTPDDMNEDLEISVV